VETVKNMCHLCHKPLDLSYKTWCLDEIIMKSDSKLLSGYPWSTNGNPDNNLESLCILHEFTWGFISDNHNPATILSIREVVNDFMWDLLQRYQQQEHTESNIG
jgi:hypothetical protein